MRSNRISPRRGRPGVGRAVLSSIVAAGVVLAGLIVPTSAMAATPGGPASLTTSVQFVSGQDLTTPISTLKANQAAPASEQRYALNITYACGAASPCTGVTIKVAPQQLDQFYGTQRFAVYDSGTLPAGATMTANTAAGGQTISLGNLAAGASGSFTLLYNWQQRLGDTPAAQSFFLDGTKITDSVTIDAANAGATQTASSSIIWHIDTEAPQVALIPSGIARSNTDYVYYVRMGSDCMNESSVGNYGEPAKLCASSFSNVLTLPAGVTFVSASDGGVYDAGAGTVTWAKSGYAAAMGWESITGYGFPRTVTVQFPDAMFTSACTITAQASFATTVTYLDGQTKTANTTASNQATDCTPFASVDPLAKWSSVYLAPNYVWDNGTPGTFVMRMGNRANVPGVATITDSGLDALTHLRFYRVDIPAGATLTYEYADGTGGTTTATQFNIPAGETLRSISMTSAPLPGPNLDPGYQPGVTYFQVNLQYVTVGTAPPTGWTVDNTASGTMSYPGTGLADVSAGSSTSEIVIAPKPANFYALMTSSFAGGNPIAGQAVSYDLWAVTSGMPADKTIEPQYVFVAPAGWDIVPNSWSLDAGAPAGAIFTTETVTIAGQSRQALYVHWPAGTTWGENTTWPQLHVQATPSTASAGSVGTASGFIGDASESFPELTAYWGSGNNNGQRFVDTPDLDQDGSTTDIFAQTSAGSYTVGAAGSISTVKEICQPNPAASDGCNWIADSTTNVPVSPVSSGITYRITVSNSGNSALSNVVAYDILPHPGDTGVSGGSAGTPRGSQFSESVDTVTAVSGNLSLSYSGSTNPCRTEVYAGGPTGCVNDWNGTAAGKVAIRAAVTGALAPGAKASFVYTAGVVGGPAAGEKGCNSIAAAASGVPVSEPSPVCAEIVAADLAVTAPATISPQLGRPATFPFTVANLSGTATTPTVTVTVPAGIRVTSLTAGAWTCTGATAPVTGPATLTCTMPAALSPGASEPLDLPAVVTVDGASLSAAVSGPLYDPAPDNNTAAIVANASPAAGTGLTVTKDDGNVSLVPGQQATYTITVANQLVGEALGPVTVTDALPDGLQFVTASNGGAQGAGGVVTWTLPSLAAAGSTSMTVTVRLAADSTANTITNTVSAQAADPAYPESTLTGTASDADQIDHIALTKSVVFVAPADPFDPKPGDVLQYRFAITNTGGGTLTDVTLEDAKAGLSAVTFPNGWPGIPGRLAPGESVLGIATYALTEADIDGHGTSNTATVTADSADAQPVSATSTVDQPLPAIGGLTLSKTATLVDSGTVHAGDTVTYSFLASNTGNVTLHGVTLADPMPGLSLLTYAWPDTANPGVLASGASVHATATYVLTQADIDRGTVTNTATASGLDVDDNALNAVDGALVGIPAAPAVTFTKTGALESGTDRPVPGDAVDWTFTITNTGNVTESGLAILDHLAGVSPLAFDRWPDPLHPGALAPGQSIRATATSALMQADIDAGEVANTATLSGTPARGDAIDEDATATVRLAQVTGLTMVKSAALRDTNRNGVGDVGEQIAYSFAITNTGNVTLADVGVADPKVSGIPTTAALAPGQTVTVAADAYTITEADSVAGSVVNTATASGTAPDDTKVVSDPSSVTTKVADPVMAETGGTISALPIALGGGALLLGAALMVAVAARRRRGRIG